MTATTQAPATVKGASMAAIRATLPTFFALDVAAIIRALSDKQETRAMLARALTGAALERAQSGNAPALMGADSALDTVKGKAARQMIDNALSHVRAIKPRTLSGQSIEAFTAFANDTHSQIVALLTPAPVAAKPKAPAVNWKERAERAEAAHAALMAYADSLAAMLAASGATAPAVPVGATLAPAPATTEAE